jgi:TolB-like protein
MPPSPEAVRQQLERVLSSSTFANAGRHTRLLRYLVERTLAGEADQLKEYVLGVEVFDRPDSFDPRLDSIVRVEARRLRTRLEEYYKGPGVEDPIEIVVARGSYVPSFASRAPEERADEAATPAPLAASSGADVPPDASRIDRRTAPRRSRPARMLIAAALLAFAVIAMVGRLTTQESPLQASGSPSVAVLPFHHYSDDPAHARTAARLTDAVTTELARLRTLAVASRTSAAQYTAEMQPVAEIREALKVDFVMEASAIATGGEIRISIRMVDAVRDRKVWVGDYSATPADVASVARRIALEASEGTLAYHARHAPR